MHVADFNVAYISFVNRELQYRADIGLHVLSVFNRIQFTIIWSWERIEVHAESSKLPETDKISTSTEVTSCDLDTESQFSGSGNQYQQCVTSSQMIPFFIPVGCHDRLVLKAAIRLIRSRAFGLPHSYESQPIRKVPQKSNFANLEVSLKDWVVSEVEIDEAVALLRCSDYLLSFKFINE